MCEGIPAMKTLICSSIVLAAFEGQGMLSARGMAEPSKVAIGNDELNTFMMWESTLVSGCPQATQATVTDKHTQRRRQQFIAKHKTYRKHNIQQPRSRKMPVAKPRAN